jgi:hypothetical protein
MSTLSAQRLEHLRSSRESACGSSNWHAANTKRGNGTGRDLGRNLSIGSPTTLTFPPTATGATEKQKKQKQKQKEAAVTITPAVVERPGRCRVRRGNGDGDGLRRRSGMTEDEAEEEGGFKEVAVAQRMGRCQRRVDSFSR